MHFLINLFLKQETISIVANLFNWLFSLIFETYYYAESLWPVQVFPMNSLPSSVRIASGGTARGVADNNSVHIESKVPIYTTRK